MSLHWILVLTVTLPHCFTATSIPFPRDIKRSIGKLQSVVCNEPDSTFYSPSGNNGCTIKALQCSVLELETVRAECFEPQSQSAQYLNRTRDIIKYTLEKINTEQADFKDCFCEKENPEEKTYGDFLINLLTLVEMVYSSF